MKYNISILQRKQSCEKWETENERDLDNLAKISAINFSSILLRQLYA